MVAVPLYFVRPFGDAQTGSTQMRGIDLLDIVGPHLGAKLNARRLVMPKKRQRLAQRLWAQMVPRNAIYFLTKRSIQAIDPEAGYILKKRARLVCVDYVDCDLKTVRSELADVHVCSSYAQQDVIRELQSNGEFAPGPTCVILHNASARLTATKTLPAPRFSTAYVGTLSMTKIPEILRGEIAIIDASDRKKFEESLNDISLFSLHYGVRQDKEKAEFVIKPFTKGVTAAMCGANIITSRTVWDAEALLGVDYPYLMEGNSESEILDTFEKARTTYGTRVWEDALRAMAQLRDLTSGPALARAIENMTTIAGPS